MSNRPTIEHHLTPAETSYLMDLLHKDWAQNVMGGAVVGDMQGRPYDSHVLHWKKARASRLLNKLDDAGWKQGFCENGVGL